MNRISQLTWICIIVIFECSLFHNSQAQVPSISSFTPTNGSTGTTVTITGTNFSTTTNNNIVKFNGITATVTASSAISITTSVPIGASTGPITVTVGGLTATSAAGFLVTWSIGKLSQARYNLSSSSVGTKVFFAGGHTGLAYSNVVDIYDNSTNTWTTATLSQARQDLSAASVGTKVFFAGGWTGSPSNVVDIYDNSTNLWTTATLSQARSLLSATTVGNKVFFGGGYSSNDSNVVDVYDNSTNTWSTTSLSQARITLTATSFGNKAFFAGGSKYVGLNAFDVVDIYDNNTNTWTNSRLSQARNYLTSTSVGAKVIFGGGNDGNNGFVASNVIDIYNNFSNTWTTSSLSLARFQLSATSVGTKALFAGGNGYGNTNTSNSNIVDIYDDNSNTWSTATLSLARFLLTATTVGTKAFFVGGKLSSGAASDVVDIYDNGADLIISSFSPIAAGVGSTITITGANFTGANAVSFGGTPATSFTVVSPTIITAVIALSSSGSVSVTTPGGTATKTGFTFVPAPVITSFTPTSAGTGATVTITGTNLTGATAVSFGGTAATSFTVVSPTSVTAVVAAGTTGSVSVTTPGGAATKVGFSFVQATPIITSFTPTSGPAGTSVTIAGTNFSSIPINNIVKFNGVTATVTASTATSITSTVPSDATTGKITVTVGSLTGTSLSNFIIVPGYLPVNGLVAWYPFNGNANDASGNGNNGIANGAILTKDRFGNPNSAYEFNQNYIKVNPAQIFDFAESMSINAWYLNRGDGGGFVSKHQRGTLNSSYFLYNEGFCGPTGYVTDIDNNVQSIRDNSMCDTNNWHMLTMTFNYPTLSVYIDGVLNNTTVTNKIKVTTLPILFGATSDPTQPNGVYSIFNGKLDDIIFYNRSLNANEVSQLYASTSLFSPTISNFNPAGGNIGTSITITGTNFSMNPLSNTVKLNGVKSTVTASTGTTITTTVPLGASTGKIAVEVGGITAISATDFCLSPQVSVTPSSVTICSGTFAILNASGASAYTWNPGAGLSATGNTLMLNPTVNTNYTITGTDSYGCTNTATLSVNVNVCNAVPGLKNGTSLEDYRIFSIPLRLSSNNIPSVLGSVFQQYGGYDEEKWRLVHYSNGDNLNYNEGLSTIEEGKGYWFLSVDPTTINVSGSAIDANLSSPFVMNLDKGWNQIGNPFGFDISWSDVLANNSSTTSVGKLFVYDPGSVSFIESDNLKAWGGGFVNTTAATNLNVPVTVKKATGGRNSSSNHIDMNIDEPSWFVPLKLEHSQGINDLAGIGMHVEASVSRDIYDENSLPRFVKYLEFNSYHDDYFQPRFMRDVAPTANNHIWNVAVETNLGEGDITLSWDNETLAQSKALLFLYDKDANLILDMKKMGSYVFEAKDKKELMIMYSIDDKHLSLEGILIGAPYPNPFSQQTIIPFVVGNHESDVFIRVYDILGRRVREIIRTKVGPGYYEEIWDGMDDHDEHVKPGMYIIRVSNGNSMGLSVRVLAK